MSFFLPKGLKSSVDETERQSDKRIETVILFVLAMLPCVIFKVSLGISSASRPRGTQLGTHCGLLLQRGVQPIDCALRGWPNLFWPQAKIDLSLRLPVSLVGICIYNFLTPTYFRSTAWLLQLIFTDASCAENLWLTARSVVNIGGPRGVMVKAMDCGIVVSEFELQSCYYVHFRANTLGKGINPFILPVMG